MEDVTESSAADDFAPEKPKNPIAAAQQEWRDSNRYVHECEKALAKAKERMNAAGLALSDVRPQQTLHELNRQQRKITRSESHRRIKFQANLDKLAQSGYNTQRKVHPPLYPQAPKPKE